MEPNQNADTQQATGSEPVPGSPLNPSAGSERLEALDALRGLAILGILSVNMMYFVWPLMVIFQGQEPPRDLMDTIVEWGVRFFAEGKFYTMFSFLFGLGMAVQMERCQASGRPFGRFFAKRLAVLAAIGLCHAILVWPGDILFNYACLGYLLLLFRNRSPRALFLWAAFFFFFFIGMVLLGLAGQMHAETAGLSHQDYLDAAAKELQRRELIESTLHTYREGSWPEMVRLRVSELGFMISTWLFSGWSILVSFLMGVWAWRRGFFQRPKEHQVFFRRVLFFGLVVGIPGSGIYTIWRGSGMGFDQVSPDMAIGVLAHHIGQFGMCYAYIAGFMLVYHSGRCSRLFSALANVGRMALTNYLSHSFFLTLIFYNHGLGLLGSVGDSTALAMTLTVFVIQIFFSRWWLSKFRFGPMEWLWRSLTYNKLQPMRRA